MEVYSVLKAISFTLSSIDAAIYSFWLSGVVLLLVYIVKYKLIRCYILGADFLAAVMDFPIDVLVIQVPIVLLSSCESGNIRFGILILFTTLITITLSYLLRKGALDAFNLHKFCSFRLWIFCLGELLLSAFIIFINYSLIRNIWIGH